MLLKPNAPTRVFKLILLGRSSCRWRLRIHEVAPCMYREYHFFDVPDDIDITVQDLLHEAWDLIAHPWLVRDIIVAESVLDTFGDTA